MTVQLPSAAAGVTVTATADPGNTIAERNEGNNTGSQTTAVSAPSLPDLRLTMAGPSSVRGVYASGVWTMTVTNIGSAPASVVNVRWLTNWGGSSTPTRSRAVPSASAAPCHRSTSSSSSTATATPPCSRAPARPSPSPRSPRLRATSTAPPVVSTVTGTVDYGLQVSESDESNNAATVVSTITT